MYGIYSKSTSAAQLHQLSCVLFYFSVSIYDMIVKTITHFERICCSGRCLVFPRHVYLIMVAGTFVRLVKKQYLHKGASIPKIARVHFVDRQLTTSSPDNPRPGKKTLATNPYRRTWIAMLMQLQNTEENLTNTSAIGASKNSRKHFPHLKKSALFFRVPVWVISVLLCERRFLSRVYTKTSWCDSCWPIDTIVQKGYSGRDLCTSLFLWASMRLAY